MAQGKDFGQRVARTPVRTTYALQAPDITIPPAAKIGGNVLELVVGAVLAFGCVLGGLYVWQTRHAAVASQVPAAQERGVAGNAKQGALPNREPLKVVRPDPHR